MCLSIKILNRSNSIKEARLKQVFITLLALTLMACAAGSQNAQYPLHNAAYKGDTQKVQEIINSGASIEAQDSNGLTPLLAATMYGKSDAARSLIKMGANVNVKNKEGYTPLLYSSQSCDVETVKLLIENGADLSAAPPYGYTPLHNAAGCERYYGRKGGLSDLDEYLLSLPNIDLTTKNSEGRSVYAEAMEYQNMKMVAALRKRGITERFQNSSAGKFDESLRAPSLYVPPAGSFEVEPGNENFYQLAIEDCNHMVVPYKKGLLLAAGPVGYGVGLLVDKVRVPGKFQQCMEVMGFKCLNNSAQ